MVDSPPPDNMEFQDNFNEPTTDPAASFLEEEENKMAELELNGETNQPPLNDLGADADDQVLEEEEENLENNQYGTTEFVELSNGPVGDSETDDAYYAIRDVDEERAEPEKIRIWREEQAVRIEQKDKDEDVNIEQWKVDARKELEEWYKNRNEQVDKAKKANRDAEDALLETTAAANSSGDSSNQWERISSLCDFNPKNAKNAKDVSKLRSLLLQMKGQQKL